MPVQRMGTSVSIVFVVAFLPACAALAIGAVLRFRELLWFDTARAGSEVVALNLILSPAFWVAALGWFAAAAWLVAELIQRQGRRA